MVEMQLPQVSDIGGGSLSPLSYYSYDQYNNVTAYCDPVYNQTNGNGWVNSPGDSLCPIGSGAARFFYNLTDTNEQYGCLSNMKKPSGYNAAISYPSTPGPCGVGLPAKAQGDQVNQYDGSTRTPTQDFGYDTYGNLTSYDRGTQGGNTLDSWTLGYDPENRLNQKTENDSTIPLKGSSFSCYYPDGSLLYTETPSQHDTDGDPNCPSTTTLLNGGFTPPQKATAYYYDTDGDQVQITTHKGCSANNGCPGATSMTACATGQSNPIGTTCKYYDGLDRLVETIEPYDSRNFTIAGQQVPYEFYAFRWMNRYIYDLSEEGGLASLTISDSTGTTGGLPAYGNLYKTREYLPQTQGMLASLSHGQYQSGSWSDIRGTSFDAMDRAVSKYELAYGTAAVTTNTYDCSGQADLLCQSVNALGQTRTYTYDAIRRVRKVAFSGTAPLADNRTYTFDADGRTASATNSLGTTSYTYDVDGNKLSVIEPANEPAASLICYAYYGDGLRSNLSIGMPSDTCGSIPERRNPSNGGISQQNIFSYSYRNDGLLATQQVNWLTLQDTFSWAYTTSERKLTETDPLKGQQVTLPQGRGQTTIGAKTYQYDGYGRVSKLTFPEGYEQSSFVYDVDDELVGYTAGGNSGTPRQFTLNARGEMLEDNTNQPLFGYAQGPTQSANGTQVGNGAATVNGNPVEAPPTTVQFDERSGMVTAIPNPQWAQGIGGGTNSAWGFSYDAAGRQYAATQYPNWPATGGSSSEGSAQFDAENHIEQTTINPLDGSFASATVQWGPDARHSIDTLKGGQSGTVTKTAHWDDDAMLFATGGAFGDHLYIGKFGIMDSSGDLYVSDRDQAGTQETSHGNSISGSPYGAWYNSWFLGSVRNIQIWNSKAQGQQLTAALAYGSCGYTQSTSPYTNYPCPLFTPAFAMTRSDGYAMVGGLVQGGRTYDPTSGQWITPDAYAGDVHDPMSQKPFMWNNNNPIAWTDPAGFVADVTATPPEQGDEGFANVNITLYVKFNGNGDSVQAEQSIISSIESAWNGTFGNYKVTTTVSTDLTGVDPSHINTITITPGGTSDNFGVDQLNNHMTVGAHDGSGWGYAHEAGHLMGLPDLYDSIKTMPLSREANPNYGSPLPGHAGDIMARQGRHRVSL